MSLMLENKHRELNGEAPMMIVDVGSVNEQSARDRVDALVAFGIGRKNVSIEGFNRILVRIPERKRAKVLEVFPIKVGTTYWQTTHNWLE